MHCPWSSAVFCRVVKIRLRLDKERPYKQYWLLVLLGFSIIVSFRVAKIKILVLKKLNCLECVRFPIRFSLRHNVQRLRIDGNIYPMCDKLSELLNQMACELMVNRLVLISGHNRIEQFRINAFRNMLSENISRWPVTLCAVSMLNCPVVHYPS